MIRDLLSAIEQIRSDLDLTIIKSKYWESFGERHFVLRFKLRGIVHDVHLSWTSNGRKLPAVQFEEDYTTKTAMDMSLEDSNV